MFRWTTRLIAPASRQDQDERARAHGAQVLAEAREELTRADTKAQVLLGVAGLGIGAVSGGLLAGNWSPLKLHPGLQWLWWVGAVCAIAALFCLAQAVYPRITKRSSGIAYFGDIKRYRSTAEIISELRNKNNGDLTELAEQIRLVSQIVIKKYTLIRWGFWLLLTSIMTTVGSAVIQLVL